jgi:Xaa-Pro dipeptidase
LHYGHQGAPDGRLQDGDTFLHDSGAEYHGYASDVTCTFPVNGRFTPEQRAIYDVVLAANRAVQVAMKPGVAWPDMHRLAVRTLASGLREIGLLKGSVDELVAKHVAGVFMPHGLGHLMGLDVHDPGGYPEGAKRSSDPDLRGLRCGRAIDAGVVITVEPGCYFIDAMLGPALANPEVAAHIDATTLARFRSVGGVRIEDDVLVTRSGSENLTQVPREVHEIESVMAGASWTPKGAAVGV